MDRPPSLLQKENLYEQVKSKLVMGENISQAASFVLSGAADARDRCLVPRSRAQHEERRAAMSRCPPPTYPPIEQGCVAAEGVAEEETAHAFLECLKTPASAEISKNYGFRVK